MHGDNKHQAKEKDKQ